MEHTFTLTKTTLKNGKFEYVVTDANNNVISKRTSTREYVACTADGYHFFGRLDLIGKGDHAKYIKSAQDVLTWTPEQFAKKTACAGTLESWKAKATRSIQELNSIAYLNQ